MTPLVHRQGVIPWPSYLITVPCRHVISRCPCRQVTFPWCMAASVWRSNSSSHLHNIIWPDVSASGATSFNLNSPVAVYIEVAFAGPSAGPSAGPDDGKHDKFHTHHLRRLMKYVKMASGSNLTMTSPKISGYNWMQKNIKDEMESILQLCLLLLPWLQLWSTTISITILNRHPAPCHNKKWICVTYPGYKLPIGW